MIAETCRSEYGKWTNMESLMKLNSSENNKQTLIEQIKRDDVILPPITPPKKNAIYVLTPASVL